MRTLVEKDVIVNNYIISKYAQDQGLDCDIAKKHFQGMVSFLDMCASSNYPCFPDRIIDNAWHTFLLFTKDYQLYCQDAYDKFIHHNPIVDEKETHFGYYCQFEEKSPKYLISSLQEINKSVCDGGGSDNCSSCRD